jgi:glycosyltransferase involved in cell wall biosynthesis
MSDEALSVRRTKVAYVTGVVPNYRRPFLERLARETSIDPTWFHGAGRAGFSVKSIGPDLPVASVWTRNILWPFGQHRIMWQCCFWRVLAGGYDVVVCEEAVHNLTTWALWLATRFSGKRFVLHGFGFRPDSAANARAGLRDRLRRLLLRSADAVLAYTDRGREVCVGGGLDGRKIFVSGNTLDVGYLAAFAREVSPKDLAVVRSSFPHPDRPILLYVGRLVASKRVDLLIMAALELERAGTPVNVLVVGDGVYEPEAKAAAAGNPSVRFLGHIGDDAELAKYFLASDLLVIPGAVGLVCMHGFAYGLPIVTSTGGVVHGPEIDYVRDQQNGIIIHEPDVAAFARVLGNALSDRLFLERLRAGARKTGAAMDMSNMVSGFVAAVEYAANRGLGSRSRSVSAASSR